MKCSKSGMLFLTYACPGAELTKQILRIALRNPPHRSTRQCPLKSNCASLTERQLSLPDSNFQKTSAGCELRHAARGKAHETPPTTWWDQGGLFATFGQLATPSLRNASLQGIRPFFPAKWQKDPLGGTFTTLALPDTFWCTFADITFLQSRAEEEPEPEKPKHKPRLSYPSGSVTIATANVPSFKSWQPSRGFEEKLLGSSAK